MKLVNILALVIVLSFSAFSSVYADGGYEIKTYRYTEPSSSGAEAPTAMKAMKKQTFYPENYMSDYYESTGDGGTPVAPLITDNNWGDYTWAVQKTGTTHYARLCRNKNDCTSSNKIANSDNSKAVVVYIHGGNWVYGSDIGDTSTKKSNSLSYMNFGANILKQNNNVSQIIYINYKLLTKVPSGKWEGYVFPATSPMDQAVKDIDAVLKQLQTNAPGTQVILMGDSAGGQLTAAYFLQKASADNNFAVTNNIKGVFLISPVPGLLLDSASQTFNKSPRYGTESIDLAPNSSGVYTSYKSIYCTNSGTKKTEPGCASQDKSINYNAGDIMFGKGPFNSILRFTPFYMYASLMWVGSTDFNTAYSNIYKPKYNALQYAKDDMASICSNIENVPILFKVVIPKLIEMTLFGCTIC